MDHSGCEKALASSVNIATWANVARWAGGRAWIGASAAIVAMLAAEQARNIANMQPAARVAVGILTAPGSVAVGIVSNQTACCDTCRAEKITKTEVS